MRGDLGEMSVRLLEDLFLHTLFPCFNYWVLSYVVAVGCEFGVNRASDVSLTMKCETLSPIICDYLVFFDVFQKNWLYSRVGMTCDFSFNFRNVLSLEKNWKKNQQFFFSQIFLPLILKVSNQAWCPAPCWCALLASVSVADEAILACVSGIEGRAPYKCKRNYCQSLSFSVITHMVISRTVWKPLLSKKRDSIEGKSKNRKSTMMMWRFKGTGETLNIILYLPNHLLSYKNLKDREKKVLGTL